MDSTEVIAPVLAQTEPLVPARMLNEFAYCPRLAYLEWVQGEFEHSVDTVEGRFRHRRVNREEGAVGDPSGAIGDDEGLEAGIHARSVLVSSERLGAIARVDLLEGEGRRVTPVDYKRGKVPSTPEGAWEPERVQVCLQGLILRHNGYECNQGVIYFVESKTRVPVVIDEALEARTLSLLDDIRQVAASGQMPPPLVDSPKCPRCSLVGICLPDEVNYLAAENMEAGEPKAATGVRRLYPARDDALPVYVQTQGVTVAKQGELLEIRSKGETVEQVRLLDVSQLCLLGNIQVTTQCIRELCAREIPVCYFSYGGRFYGITQGMAHKNVELRRAQYHLAEDAGRSLELAAQFVQAKILNCRTLLRRNSRQEPARALHEMAVMARKATRATASETLLGIEGAAARTYFAHFSGMLKPRTGDIGEFDFEGRNRRPPRDPVNALLSLAYAMLTKDMAVTLFSVGFDPYLGFYHSPRYGRPSLALDLMEEFRPLVADSVVISAINNGEIDAQDFYRRAGAVSLKDSGRRKFLEAYERRMDSLITHPIFGYRISYRRVIEVQARLLGRFITGEIDRYPAFRTR